MLSSCSGLTPEIWLLISIKIKTDQWHLLVETNACAAQIVRFPWPKRPLCMFPAPSSVFRILCLWKLPTMKSTVSIVRSESAARDRQVLATWLWPERVARVEPFPKSGIFEFHVSLLVFASSVTALKAKNGWFDKSLFIKAITLDLFSLLLDIFFILGVILSLSSDADSSLKSSSKSLPSFSVSSTHFNVSSSS